MPTLITFRDFDPLYKWPRYNVTWKEHNKVGYLTQTEIAIYPLRFGLKKTPLNKIKHRYRIIPLPSIPLDDNIESFFTRNRDSPYLFICGIKALTQNLAFFNSPIKLPILDQITAQQFQMRWKQFISLLRPGDWIQTIDTKSIVSRTIALVDHGVWSHGSTYTGAGQICEAITSGVVERRIDVYQSPRYRLGLYRPNEPLDSIQPRIAFLRSQIGKPYGYQKMLRLAFRKLLHLPPTQFMPSPNDVVFLYDAPLIYVV
jgi:hypothetical protein